MSPQSVLSAARRLDGSRRFLVLGLVAAAIAVIGVVGRWASTPGYVTLYRDLDLAESGQMVDQLGKAGIPRRLASGGAELQVPAAELARARVLLAKTGLPTNGRPGLELFDKQTWGMTDFTQRVTYQRALEGELARTIAGIRGIDRAQVHLVLTSSSALRRLDRPASASVVLSLKGGAALAPDAVQGITYIVANSVEQLSSENVAVMDDAGHVLSVPAGDGAAGLTTRQLEMQRGLERHTADKIEELLATVVGPGSSRAEVSAELSFDQAERTVESFDPDGQVLENEQRSEGGAGGGAEAAQTVINNSYQNSRRLEKSVEAAGRIKRLTIAVLVDQKALKGGVGGRPKLETDALQAMVANAAGVDSARGDRVSVMAVAFDAALVGKDAPGTGSEKPKVDPMVMIERVSHPLVGLVAIAALVLVAFVAFRGLGGSPAGTELAAATAGAGAGGAPEALPTPQLAPLQPVKKDASGMEVEFQRKLVSGSQDRLDAAAQVVKSWLAES